MYCHTCVDFIHYYDCIHVRVKTQLNNKQCAQPGETNTNKMYLNSSINTIHHSNMT